MNPQQAQFHGQQSHAGQQAIQSKLQIPKVLPEKATQVPTPVQNMGGIQPGRPSYTGGTGIAGGVMGQPALPKIPAYQLEGDGTQVLNKKKLDELVRQVSGGTAEGQEGDLLTPDVEEVSCFAPFPSGLPCVSGSLTCIAVVRPQPGRQLRRQRPALSLQECQGTRKQGARDPRHPARA
jgi:hypothetical protein